MLNAIWNKYNTAPYKFDNKHTCNNNKDGKDCIIHKWEE